MTRFITRSVSKYQRLFRSRIHIEKEIQVSVSSLSRYDSSCTRYNHNNSTFRDCTTIGFLGVGNMGLPMLKNLIQRHNVPEEHDPSARPIQVFAYDLDLQAMKRAEAVGAVSVSSLDQITHENPDFIITVLPKCSNDVISEMVRLLSAHPYPRSPNTPQKSCTFIDCSTIGVSSSRLNHQIVAATNLHHMIDAPVSGGVKGAEDATLTFMVGVHSQEILERAKPILLCMGKAVKYCGGPSAGIAVKLCNNLALATQMIGICEAMNLGRALNIDPVVLADVMNSSTAGCWSCKVNNPDKDVSRAIGTGAALNNYEGGFASKLMLKDLSLAMKAAEGNNVSLPLTSNAHQLYQMLNLHGYKEKDFSVMLEFLQGKKSFE